MYSWHNSKLNNQVGLLLVLKYWHITRTNISQDLLQLWSRLFHWTSKEITGSDISVSCVCIQRNIQGLRFRSLGFFACFIRSVRVTEREITAGLLNDTYSMASSPPVDLQFVVVCSLTLSTIHWISVRWMLLQSITLEPLKICSRLETVCLLQASSCWCGRHQDNVLNNVKTIPYYGSAEFT